MLTAVVLPKSGGLDSTHGTVIEWLRDEGAFVQRGELIVSIETDKVDYSLEAPIDGVLLKILVAAGDDVPVGATLAMIGDPGDVYEDG